MRSHSPLVVKTITLVLAIFDLIRYRSHRLSISWVIDLMGYWPD
ncbi:hypothetical protein YpF1991016_2965 [Yersinia pestis biovar Orientalis str. F1991016]|nr:hypothetical protein YpF1991016_2965 [Yersinia pestis biovar Orientalis str. F1991016]